MRYHRSKYHIKYHRSIYMYTVSLTDRWKLPVIIDAMRHSVSNTRVCDKIHHVPDTTHNFDNTDDAVMLSPV